MTHGEPYEFIQLGLHLERAPTTARIRSRYPVAIALAATTGAAHELIALLKSCSAFEAYVKRHGATFEPLDIARGAIRAVPALGALLPRRARTPSTGSPASRGRRTGSSGASAPTSSTARSTTSRAAAWRRRSGASSPASAAPATRSRRRSSRAARSRRPRSRSRRASSSNVAERRARDAFAYDAPLTEAYPSSGSSRHTFTGSDARRSLSSPSRAARPRRVCRPVREHRAPLRRPRAARAHHVTARSEVWTAPRFVDAAPLSPLDRFASSRRRYVPSTAGAELAASASDDPAQTAGELMHAVRSDDLRDRHDQRRTLADEAFAAGHGVCQDFAHVMIGVCRLHGIPARYVSGYLYDPRRDGSELGLARLGRRAPRPRLGLARPDPRPRADRALRPARRRPRLRGRPSLARRLQRQRRRDARGRRHDPRALSPLSATSGCDRRRAAPASRRESSSIASAICQRRAVRLADLVRDRPDLDRRHVRRAPRHGGRRSPPSPRPRASPADAADGRARPDRQRRCAGKRLACRGDAAARRRGARSTSADRCREVAVDGLGADHERPRCEPTAAGDADVQHGARTGRSASARAVAAAASTGPIPQTSPSRPSSSRSVAATRRTSGTRRSYARRPPSHSGTAHNRLTGAPQRRRVSSMP